MCENEKNQESSGFEPKEAVLKAGLPAAAEVAGAAENNSVPAKQSSADADSIGDSGFKSFTKKLCDVMAENLSMPEDYESAMDAEEIVERIMTMHWDMVACTCWICREGRKSGLSPKDKYLPHKSNVRVGNVIVEMEKKKLPAGCEGNEKIQRENGDCGEMYGILPEDWESVAGVLKELHRDSNGITWAYIKEIGDGGLLTGRQCRGRLLRFKNQTSGGVIIAVIEKHSIVWAEPIFFDQYLSFDIPTRNEGSVKKMVVGVVKSLTFENNLSAMAEVNCFAPDGSCTTVKGAVKKLHHDVLMAEIEVVEGQLQ